MTITIFGATGIVGKQLVREALYMGHNVKAFGRNVFTSNFPENKNLDLIQGALFDEREVLNAIKKSDAVISVLGGKFDGQDNTRSLGIKNIIKQMDKANVKRIIALGGMGILNAADNTMLIDADDYPVQFLPVGMEHLKAYQYLEASDLDWTFVCSPDIINADVTGLYHTAANYLPVPNRFKINTGDLAMFMLNELKKNEYIKKRVGISN